MAVDGPDPAFAASPSSRVSPSRPDGLQSGVIADKLAEARKLIEAGWTRGDYQRKRGGRVCYCSIGAIDKAAPSYVAQSLMRAFVKAAAKTDSLVRWNDQQKSKKPVIAAFREAEKLAREQVSA